MKLNIIRIFWAVCGGLALNGIINEHLLWMLFGTLCCLCFTISEYYVTHDKFLLKKHFLEMCFIACVTSAPFAKEFELFLQLLLVSWVLAGLWIFLMFFCKSTKLEG